MSKKLWVHKSFLAGRAKVEAWTHPAKPLPDAAGNIDDYAISQAEKYNHENMVQFISTECRFAT